MSQNICSGTQIMNSLETAQELFLMSLARTVQELFFNQEQNFAGDVNVHIPFQHTLWPIALNLYFMLK